MAVVRPRKRSVFVAALMLLGAAGAAPALADANGRLATAMGLTAADGSVRTQAGVQLSISPLPGYPDRVVAMGAPVQARMPSVRQCFSAAMAKSSATEGVIEFDVEAARGGAAKVKVASDATHDPELVQCMRSALARAPFATVARGARSRVRLELSNPLAELRRQLAGKSPTENVRMLSGGRAESAGGTEDIRFRVSGSAYAAPTIARVAEDMSTRIAGLLDCRRKAFRREREVSGSITLPVAVRHGELAPGTPQSTVKPAASRCVAAWLSQLDTKSLADADLELAVSFAQAR